MTNKDERFKEILRDLAAKFLQENGNGSSLLTVTRVELTKDRKHATIFFTVFPDKFEKTAFSFVERKSKEFRNYIKENARLAWIPEISFKIDFGEKNRQRIDTLLNE